MTYVAERERARFALRRSAMFRMPQLRSGGRWRLVCGCATVCLMSAPTLAKDIPDPAQDIIVLNDTALAASDLAILAGSPIVPSARPVFSLAVPASLEPPADADSSLSDPTIAEYDLGADELPIASAPVERRPYASFGEDVKAIKWEAAAVAGYYTAINAQKLFNDPRWPRTKSEGWFGRDTRHVGVDKLAHSYSAYVISEVLHARLRRNTGDAPGIQWTAAALAFGAMAWTEVWDSIEPDSGWSWEDVAFNAMGAGLSVMRNSVPGLDKKLDFRLMIEPNEEIYTLWGQEHFRQQRYFFALKLAGFEAFERSPLRYTELHLGYRGDDFLEEDRAAGLVPKRHVFVGLGLNLRELLFKNPRSRAGRAAGEVLDYFQPPFTAIHHNITE